MPCYDPRDHISQDVRNESNRADELSTRCNELTNLLCMAGRAQFRGEPIPQEVMKYWIEHMRMDEANGRSWCKE